MAIVTNASTSYAIKASGVEEDVIDIKDIIYDISPTETPFINSVGTRNVSNTVFEWMVESLSATDTTVTIEGETISAAAASLSTRKTNICQIMHRAVSVSATQEKMKLYGKTSQMAHQMARRTKELKRSVEAALLSNQARADGDASTARASAMILSWMDTNTSVGTGGTTDGADATTPGSTARTDASADAQRDITAALINTVAQSCYENGGEPSMLMVGPFNKTQVSTLTGRSIAREMIDSNTAGSNVTVFATDFGDLQVMPNRFQRERDAILLDPEYFKVAYLRNFSVETLGKTGDATSKFVIVECGLESTQEASSGLIADLTTS